MDVEDHKVSHSSCLQFPAKTVDSWRLLWIQITRPLMIKNCLLCGFSRTRRLLLLCLLCFCLNTLWFFFMRLLFFFSHPCWNLSVKGQILPVSLAAFELLWILNQHFSNYSRYKLLFWLCIVSYICKCVILFASNISFSLLSLIHSKKQQIRLLRKNLLSNHLMNSPEV